MISNYISYVGQDPSAVRLGDSGLTPTAVVNAYGVPAGTGAGVKIGIVSLGGGWLASDFDQSMTDLGLYPTVTSANIHTVLIDGAVNNFDGGNGSIENTLDLYCAAAVAPEADITIYIGQNTISGFARVLDRAVTDNCDVITVSWGLAEYGFLEGVFRWMFEPIFARAVAQGTTIFVATGDLGSEATYGTGLSIQYPAGSPNVVAVGGTNLLLYPSGAIQSETVSQTSGGGVSSIFAAPAWQQGLTYTSYSNVPGTPSRTLPLLNRGTPDISAPMNAYDLYLAGAIQQVGGTSAAAPVMAGVMARTQAANGARLPQLNPLFYNNPGAFYDFASGNDTGWIDTGYRSTVGWDPVVGLGRIEGSALAGMFAPQKPKIKTADSTWSTVANTWVKTDSVTWTQIQTVWAKTVNGWQQTH